MKLGGFRMECEQKVITYEQLIAACLLIYGREVSSRVILKVCALFKKELGSKFILQDGPLSNIENYIDYDGQNIKLKEEFNLSTVIKDDFTIKNKLAILAGNDALGYVDFLCNKGCLNCTNPTCEFLIMRKWAWMK
jgi:hypothetical protein